jgi:ABC-type sulfate transport system substrate-binding protein
MQRTALCAREIVAFLKSRIDPTAFPIAPRRVRVRSSTMTDVAARYADSANPKRFPDPATMGLFRIDYIDQGGWDAAQKRFFADGGIFDQIYQPSGN